ncbi:MAG TPA: methyltransferase [Verrucomicrobiae bacterium]|nr:methyltransferase [Verrucomicrobiae bacterium]
MKQSAKPDFAVVAGHLRAMFRSRLLVAAVHHLKVFEQFDDGALAMADLRRRLGLKERPAMVLFPALRAMSLLKLDSTGKLFITALGRCLTIASTPNLVSYLGLEKDDPGVIEMASRLKNDGPLNAGQGIAYVKEGTEPSPMDDAKAARYLTLALAGRAGILSPIAAEQMPRLEGHLLDVAGGSGLFAYEWLRLNPKSSATVFDRPRVLAVAAEFLEEFCRSGKRGADSVKKRVKLQPGNMLEDTLPRADMVLAASLFHDWPEETCVALARRFAGALNPGGSVWAHDAFLDDTMDGPLAVADYSAQLFWVTKGRCYSRREYRDWFARAGLLPVKKEIPTAMDYSLISARKPR